MPSLSIKARIDEDVWESMRADGETNTQLLQRIVSEHQSQSHRDARLADIDPNPDIALGMLLNSHRLAPHLPVQQSTEPPVSETPAKPKISKFDVSQY